ncbi:hypothetical protein RFN30_29235 [Mesorhizobium sp. VK23D]|nr:hypothetical protein [Mesorhizobium sp. VK23D]
MAELVQRLGPDHGAMHWDLIRVIYCHECRAAGRDDRNLQFTNHAVTPDKRKAFPPARGVLDDFSKRTGKKAPTADTR